MSGPTVVLVGNPNVGKSALFGALTGKYVAVSNYPGTTVEITRGSLDAGGRRLQIVDTPGTNDLHPMSEDERVTRDILLAERRPTVVQVADAKNLRRALLLAAQLCDAEVPFVLALNMSDEARGRGIVTDTGALSRLLGVPVVETVAVERRGLRELEASLAQARVGTFRLSLSGDIETAVAEVQALFASDAGLGRRALALALLAGDESLVPLARAHLDARGLARLDELRRNLRARYAESLHFVVSRQRLRAVDGLLDSVSRRESAAGEAAWARVLGRFAMHPVYGWPIVAAVLLGAWYFVGQLGAGVAVDFLESTVFGEHVLPALQTATRAITPASIEPWLLGDKGLLFGEYGLISMALTYALALILPIVTTFFVAFSILEDSGYLPRLAVMLDRAFRLMGLNGKAVLPMVLGLGCDTMATMTARILETRKERVLVTLLLALGVPCSAQLSLILAMTAGAGPWALAAWLAVVLSVLLAVGWLAARLLPGRGSDFILELPPMRRPALGNILVKTVARVEWYLKEAVPLFFLGTALLWTADRLGALTVIERGMSPVVEGLLGLPREATAAFILGFLRRDYGAAGLIALFRPHLGGGAPPEVAAQMLTAMVTITLFVPCIANLLMMVRERGWKTALAMVAFIFPFAFAMGGVVARVARWAWGVPW